MAHLKDLARYLDELLGTTTLPDFPNALNGVQAENWGDVTGVAAAVDASTRTIRGAIGVGANLLLVHHGLYWSGLQPFVGAHRRRLALLLEGDLAVYSSHLPLDSHPEIGNNVLLARELRLSPSGGFGRFQSMEIGVMGEDEVPTPELVVRCVSFARRYGGEVRQAGVPERGLTKRWGICTGAGAGAETLQEARDRGIDTMIVGEGPHWTAVDADEQGPAIIYAGHYATETLGVQALARKVSDEFGLPWTFIDAPTGL